MDAYYPQVVNHTFGTIGSSACCNGACCNRDAGATVTPVKLVSGAIKPVATATPITTTYSSMSGWSRAAGSDCAMSAVHLLAT
jgi:hypothetical protein